MTCNGYRMSRQADRLPVPQPSAESRVAKVLSEKVPNLDVLGWEMGHQKGVDGALIW